MKKVFYLLVIILFTALSCKKEEERIANTCSVGNPVQDLPWLREKVKALQSQATSSGFIEQATYQGQTVFIFSDCCTACNTVVPVYNCQGELICTLYSPACPDFLEQVKDRITIATPKRQDCNL